MTRLWLTLAVVLCVAAPARADRVTKLFPLADTGLPRTLRGAPGELTRVLAKSFAAEIAATPIEDAAELVGCDLGSRACLVSIADKVGAAAILFGRIERTGGEIVVRLTAFDPVEGEQQKSFTIEGDTPDALADSLAERIAAASKPVDAEPPKITDDPPAPKPDPDAGRVTTGTWALVLGGGIGVGGGLVFLASANSLGADIRRAPTQTRTQIEQLRGLEKAARTRAQIGAGLVIAGGAVATIGIVRAVIQHRSPAREQPLVDVVPAQGGASVVLNLEWK